MQRSVSYLKPSGQVALFVLFMILGISLSGFSQKYELPSVRYHEGKLVYSTDSLGNQIPDYSYCGYQLSEKPIPYVPVKVFVPQIDGDATVVIQNAIDYIASLPLNTNGFRGAILLQEGIFKVTERLRITTSGIVIRGSGSKTILRAVGQDRENLFRISGKDDCANGDTILITDSFVPVNAKSFHVEHANGLKVGSTILVHRPSTELWIKALQMEDFGGQTEFLGWKANERNINWYRKITKIDGNTISLDAPITASLDTEYGGGQIINYTWPGRISNVGVENLVLESDFDSNNPKDENHCWFAISMENVENAWVRQVQFHHFAGSAVALFETAKSVTVEDCISENPVSEIGGQRRNTFFTIGQQTLFLRCYAKDGYHDFGTGFCAAGPNAFVQCQSEMPHNYSGTLDSWATGALFDNVNVDGQKLSLINRGQEGKGAGWTAANSMLWQCSAAWIECYKPPTAVNFAYGTWGQFGGDGIWYEANTHIRPRSLFFQQLAERLGKNSEEYAAQIMPHNNQESTSSPDIDLAAKLTDDAYEPAFQLKDFILKAKDRNPIPTDLEDAISALSIKGKKSLQKPVIIPVEIKKGRLIRNSELLIGAQFNVRYWSGNFRPFAASVAEPALTRNVPGRIGNGYVDDLDQIIHWMDNNHVTALYHNYGLWYDRRRDDHEMIRRMDGNVWPPFYELPFSRSGQGIAWDGLSKYDLTKFNPWYWNRLSKFAALAEQDGKILIHQNYFQHNILEAGAHWADFPWRSANNINHTGFQEPVNYAGHKRNYMAQQFYDIADSARRELHRNYIRKCLSNFAGKSNVIQSISAEYTGPLEFMQFWLDVVADWEKETGQRELISLCATKDVQDAILADPVRSKTVDLIDIRYWGYRSDGSLYAPQGGKNLAPRQHARKVNPGGRSFESIYKAVAEYRTKYPDKPVIYSEGSFTNTGWSVFNYSEEENNDLGWAVFMAGGSLGPIPGTDPEFLQAAAGMSPAKLEGEPPNVWAIQDEQNMILYSRLNQTIPLKLDDGVYYARFINPKTGQFIEKQTKLNGGKNVTLELPFSDNLIIWINKNLKNR